MGGCPDIQTLLSSAKRSTATGPQKKQENTKNFNDRWYLHLHETTSFEESCVFSRVRLDKEIREEKIKKVKEKVAMWLVIAKKSLCSKVELIVPIILYSNDKD